MQNLDGKKKIKIQEHGQFFIKMFNFVSGEK